jgi:hypothetical protein
MVTWSAEFKKDWANTANGFDEEFTLLETDDLGPQPAVHSVALFAEGLASQASLPTVHAEVLLKAGVYTTKFRCDWRGVFSAVFQSLIVRLVSYNASVTDNDSGYAFVATEAGQYRHVASVGYGGFNHAKPLTYTLRQRTVYSTGGTRCEIGVPPFARRFYPRIVHYLATNWDSNGLQMAPLSPAGLRGVSIQLDGQHYGQLSEQIAHDGIDVLGASLITLKPITTSGQASLVTPVFELGL